MHGPDPREDPPEVIVIGAGIAGLASCILLAQAGVRVTCVEPQLGPRERVGESFDLSAPALLGRLGLERDEILTREIGTFKEYLRMFDPHDLVFVGKQWPWLRQWPIKLDPSTYHVDRQRFDAWLFQRARALGVEFIEDKINEFVLDEGRVDRVLTRAGLELHANWFIDASGAARLLARAAEIPRIEFGQRKVTLFAQLALEHDLDGTSLYLDGDRDYLEWVWEIPLDDQRASIGYTLPATRMKAQRSKGMSSAEVFRAKLSKFGRLRAALEGSAELELSTCSFQPYVHERASGDNWFLVGEAAAMQDPITAGGVTAGLRNAESAVRTLIRARRRGRLSPRQRSRYDLDARMLLERLNIEMERLVYAPELRRSFGLHKTLKLYLFSGFLAGYLYSRVRPRSGLGLRLFAGFLWGLQVWGSYWLSRARSQSPRAVSDLPNLQH